MKKISIFILCLALTSLACLQTAMAAQNISATASATFVKVQVYAADPTPSPSPKSTNDFGEVRRCARVVAIESLHLRQEASENSLHLAYMQHGEVVRVLDRSNVDWWFVERKGISGYARSVYLQESECE